MEDRGIPRPVHPLPGARRSRPGIEVVRLREPRGVRRTDRVRSGSGHTRATRWGAFTARLVDALVVDARCLDLAGPRGCGHRAGLVMAVADHEPAARDRVPAVSQLGYSGIGFGFQGGGEHCLAPSRTTSSMSAKPLAVVPSASTPLSMDVPSRPVFAAPAYMVFPLVEVAACSPMVVRLRPCWGLRFRGRRFRLGRSRGTAGCGGAWAPAGVRPSCGGGRRCRRQASHGAPPRSAPLCVWP